MGCHWFLGSAHAGSPKGGGPSKQRSPAGGSLQANCRSTHGTCHVCHDYLAVVVDHLIAKILRNHCHDSNPGSHHEPGGGGLTMADLLQPHFGNPCCVALFRETSGTGGARLRGLVGLRRWFCAARAHAACAVPAAGVAATRLAELHRLRVFQHRSRHGASSPLEPIFFSASMIGEGTLWNSTCLQLTYNAHGKSANASLPMGELKRGKRTWFAKHGQAKRGKQRMARNKWPETN